MNLGIEGFRNLKIVRRRELIVICYSLLGLEIRAKDRRGEQ